jgi:hypothetical protein
MKPILFLFSLLCLSCTMHEEPLYSIPAGNYMMQYSFQPTEWNHKEQLYIVLPFTLNDTIWRIFKTDSESWRNPGKYEEIRMENGDTVGWDTGHFWLEADTLMVKLETAKSRRHWLSPDSLGYIYDTVLAPRTCGDESSCSVTLAQPTVILSMTGDCFTLDEQRPFAGLDVATYCLQKE